MFRKLILPVLAAIGVIFAIYTVVTGSRAQPPAAPVAEPSQAPYDSYVAGAGIVEANSEDIEVGTHVAGVVTKIFVKVGSHVKAGEALFQLDDRQLRAQLLVDKAALESAKAKVNADRATVEDLENQFTRWKSVADARAVSEDELDRRKFAMIVGQARQLQSQADQASAEAQVQATEIDIDRLTVRAPVEGDVLQVKIRLGEFAQAGALATPLMLLGDIEPLHVRVDIDENDAWRVRADNPATAFVRGNRNLQTPLKFVRIEPYVVPKRSLTGDSTERVDTRVLQVIYSFDRAQLPVYVGQQMDVFIQAPGVASTAGTTTKQSE